MPTASILDLIGHTPLIRAHRLDTGVCELYLKLESHNPGGSIKDRIGLSMINAAEQQGLLEPGGIIVEATAGNTGLGLALVAAQKGYRLILVVPDKMSREKILHLQALGTEVVLTRSDVGKGHPAYYQDLARSIADKTPGAYYIDQFNNPANPEAHETGTGPEIWEQMAQQVDAVVVGVGSSGTLTGLSRFFVRVSPQTEFVLADPVGSILADYVETGKFGEAGSWLVEGIGEDFIPPQADLSRVRRAFRIPDSESFETARQILLQEGILAGSSSGTLVAAALRYCREQTQPKRVVAFICDTGSKYLSKMYNHDWMLDQGLISLPQVGNLTDLIPHRHDLGQSIAATPDETLSVAYQRMRLFDVSQMPVLEQGRVVGILDEWDVLLSVHGETENFQQTVGQTMTSQVQTLTPNASLQDLLHVFNEGFVALVVDQGRYLGLITQNDLLSFWRRQPRPRSKPNLD
jgi:cystathionine beta-synthase